jgi:hypothetical protein
MEMYQENHDDEDAVGQLHCRVVAEYQRSLYDPDTLNRIEELKLALNDAISLRDELGFDGALDPTYGEVDDIQDALFEAYGNTRQRSGGGRVPAFVRITRVGARLLTPDLKSALAMVSSHAEARAVFDKIIAEYGAKTALQPSDLYSLSYEGHEIVSMNLPSL